jgi:hypothetical protein
MNNAGLGLRVTAHFSIQRATATDACEVAIMVGGVASRNSIPAVWMARMDSFNTFTSAAYVLAKCLVGMSSSQWYALINSKLFFWLDPARLNRQRVACEPRPQVVVEIDTDRLVADHAGENGSFSNQHETCASPACDARLGYLRAVPGVNTR